MSVESQVYNEQYESHNAVIEVRHNKSTTVFDKVQGSRADLHIIGISIQFLGGLGVERKWCNSLLDIIIMSWGNLTGRTA